MGGESTGDTMEMIRVVTSLSLFLGFSVSLYPLAFFLYILLLLLPHTRFLDEVVSFQPPCKFCQLVDPAHILSPY